MQKICKIMYIYETVAFTVTFFMKAASETSEAKVYSPELEKVISFSPFSRVILKVTVLNV